MLSNERVSLILNDIRDVCYIACHFDNPRLAGAYASEVSGGGYNRVLCAFTEPASRTIWSTTSVIFSGLNVTRVTHIVGWDALYEGTPMFIGELKSPINVIANGGGFQLLPGEIAVSL